MTQADELAPDACPAGRPAPRRAVSPADAETLDSPAPGPRRADPPTPPADAETLDTPSTHRGASPPERPEPDPALGPGARFGPYRLRGVLGRGGMGVVYRAEHEGLRRVCALKTLRPELAGSPAAARFLREGRTAARFGKHPSIVEVYDAGEVRGAPYLAMELIDGEPLSEIVERAGPLPAPRALEIGRRVALALDHLHACGVVHRDVKPQNILLDPAGAPVLCDFGLARDLRDDVRLSRSGALIGTPAYMAPEQADPRRGSVDGRADVYALGATLYYALSGVEPFVGDSLAGTLLKILEDDPPPLADTAPVSRAVSAIVERSLRKVPSDRYPTALAMADDLSRALRDQPVEARSWGRLRRLARRAQKHRGVAVLSGVLLLLALSTGLGLWLQRREVSRLWTDLARRSAGDTRAVLTGLIAPALPLIEECAASAEGGFLAVADPPRLGHQLATRFRFRPDLDMLTYADESGRYLGVWRGPDGEVRVSRSWPVGAGRRGAEAVLRGDALRWGPEGAADEGYDPRVRPWYRRAAQAPGAVWTEPYPWVHGGGVGISLCRALRVDERVMGVFTVDYRLEALARFLRALDLGPGGVAMVLTPSGRPLTGPEGAVREKDAERLARAQSALGRPFAELGAEEVWTASVVDPPRGLERRARYTAAFAKLSAPGGLEGVVAIVIPAGALHGPKERVLGWIASGAGIALVLALAGAAVLEVRRRRRLVAELQTLRVLR